MLIYLILILAGITFIISLAICYSEFQDRYWVKKYKKLNDKYFEKTKINKNI